MQTQKLKFISTTCEQWILVGDMCFLLNFKWLIYTLIIDHGGRTEYLQSKREAIFKNAIPHKIESYYCKDLSEIF